MDSDSEEAGGSPPSSPWSNVGGRDATGATTTIPATPPETTGCQQATLKEEFEKLAAYLAKEKAPKAVHNAFQRIHDAYAERADKQATTDAIRTVRPAISYGATLWHSLEKKPLKGAVVKIAKH
jgi:hypothetical protein